MRNQNMTSVTIFLLCTYMCLIASQSEFITLDCPEENHGVYGQRSVVVCVVRSTKPEEEVTIKSVAWSKNATLLLFSGGEYIIQTPDVQFAEPAWNERTMNVSLLLTNTKMTDMGLYRCTVDTDMGHKKVITRLSVTAKYKTPTMNSIPGENIKEGTDVTMFCNSTGGDQVGSIKWYDEYGSDWTRSSQLVSQKTEDGLFNLSSKFTVLGASTSTSPTYRCSVHNARGVQEGEDTLELHFQSPFVDPGHYYIKYVTPLVVIGLLVVGLLFTVRFCRRRSQQARRPSAAPLMSHQPISTHDLELHPEDG